MFLKIVTYISTIMLCSFCSGKLMAQDVALQNVRLAQQDYLLKDGNQLLKHSKESLISSNNHPLIVNNIASLYKAAEKNGILDNAKADWQVPEEIKYLNVGINRRYLVESGKVRFFVSAFGQVSEPDIIEQLQIIRYPDKVVLDKQAGVGEWKNERWGHGEPAFWISENWRNQPVDQGLYLINIKIKNKQMVQGWFVLTDENSSASPVVTTPQSNQIFKIDQPTFRWTNFHSPELKAGEKTKITLKISNEESGKYEKIIDAQLQFDPKIANMELRVGDKAQAKEYVGVESLTPGTYQFSLIYREQHQVGDLHLSRVSSTQIPFSVRTQSN